MVTIESPGPVRITPILLQLPVVLVHKVAHSLLLVPAEIKCDVVKQHETTKPKVATPITTTLENYRTYMFIFPKCLPTVNLLYLGSTQWISKKQGNHRKEPKKTEQKQTFIEPNKDAEGRGGSSPSSLVALRQQSNSQPCLPNPFSLVMVGFAASHSLYLFLLPFEVVGQQVLQVEVCL